MTIPSLPLNDGHSIPQLGLGTSPLDDEETADAIVAAAEAGYRHIDSATRYGNETGVGEGIRRTGIPREEFFVTTKLDGEFQGEDRAIAGLAAALQRMEFEYVDLLLIHWPKPWEDQYVSTWQTFEQLKAGGADPLDRRLQLQAGAPRPPGGGDRHGARGQPGAAEPLHVVRSSEREYHDAHGIVTESYSPFGAGGRPAAREPVLTAIGERYGKSPAQVVIRWHLQSGLVVIPRSSSARADRAERRRLRLRAGCRTISRRSTELGGDAGNDSDHTGH